MPHPNSFPHLLELERLWGLQQPRDEDPPCVPLIGGLVSSRDLEGTSDDGKEMRRPGGCGWGAEAGY